MKENKYIIKLKEELAEMFERKYIFLVGRATTGIYLTLKALRIRCGDVILPNILCPDPAYAAIYNGLKLKFCDVNIYDYNMNIDSLYKVINKETKVIIPVHLFGQPAEIDTIMKIAEENNLYVVEDVAQALGGKYKNKKLGSFGDISILSFAGKIINVHDGGAILTNDKKIAEKIEKEIKKLPSRPKKKKEMSNISRSYYYTIKNVSKKINEFNYFLLPLPYIFKELYIYKFDDQLGRDIYFELKNLDVNNKKRKQNTKEYIKRLQHPNIIHPEYKYFNEGTIFRYSILITKERDKITKAIRRNNFDASNLYDPLTKIYSRYQKNKKFTNAEFIGDHIINLWVEPSISKEYIEGICNTITENLNDL